MKTYNWECLIQLTKLGYDATPFNQILKQNAKREMRLRSEERFSRNAETDLVCRLLLEKKKTLDAAHPISADSAIRPPAGSTLRGHLACPPNATTARPWT